MYLNKVKFYRLQKNLTLKQLAIASEFSIGYICHLERGSRKNPSMQAMERIATVLGKTVPEIFFNEGDENGKEKENDS